MERKLNKKRVILVALIFISAICGVSVYFIQKGLQKPINQEAKVDNKNILKSSGVYYDPEYNSEYITNINEINIENKEIKNSYQFVYMADLQASIIDENEENEELKEALITRHNDFASLNPNHVRTRRNIWRNCKIYK